MWSRKEKKGWGGMGRLEGNKPLSWARFALSVSVRCAMDVFVKEQGRFFFQNFEHEQISYGLFVCSLASYT